MYIAVWKYIVHPEKQSQFIEAYCSTGQWSKLFRKHNGYLVSTLFSGEGFFLLIDHWKAKEDYEEFKRENRFEYETLSEKLRQVYLSEEKLGEFQEIDG